MSHFVSHRLSIHNESQSQGLAAIRISDAGGTPSKTKEGKLNQEIRWYSFFYEVFFKPLSLSRRMDAVTEKVTRKLGAEKVAVQDVFK